MIKMKKSKQAVANEKWEINNRERSNYLKLRSSARSFINTKATVSDLKELIIIINERLNCDK